MSKKDYTSIPLEGADATEQKLWKALGDLPLGEPSSELRRRFYSNLHEASRPRWTERLNHWLGLKQNGGWITVAAALVFGFGVAQVLERPETDSARFVSLEQNVSRLQRELILDRLQDDSASTRLQGVVDASLIVANEPLVAQALLERAAQDRSLSVRSAAIDALGSQISSGDIGSGLMQLLEGAESPIVQLAVIDLVLRHGNTQQITRLQQLADRSQIHPDLIRHVNNALRSQTI
jgi:hypothetical protein